MKSTISKLALIAVLVCSIIGLSGCAVLKKKFIPKKKEKIKAPVYYQIRKYDVKPSIELYEKHYVYWINWHRKLIDELGENPKSDIRCAQETIGHVGDMATLLVDEKAEKLASRIGEMQEAKAIIDKRNMTTANRTRIMRILERSYRVIKRDFSPSEMRDYIREEWKEVKIGEDD